ncbi:efflux transporter outer membrane subunit [Laribacter hongkongensis]|uniref:efflux transporter outer membrane subunit n=1 Tax=Laribacter hongkongensis TaxID=168471 RepID=UPI001EFEF043|nr:efflux transporter outer membrane subunit [Laribacter hongkongensis]MCG9124423.1 efflux transporter outer membrane subunit [Laribacter hongkongensis]
MQRLRQSGTPPAGLLCLVVLLSAGMLAGCAVSTGRVTADAVLPVHYPGVTADENASAASLPWQEVFRDPHLQALIRQALAYNRDLQLATARVAEARALYGIQEAGSRPGLELNTAAARGRTPADLSITRQAQVAGEYSVNAGLIAYEIDFWGRVKSLREAALAQYLATDEARQAFETSLIALVANAHLTALELDERIRLARKTLASREESWRIMQKRSETGAGSDLELREVETLVYGARSELALLERQRAQTGALIRQLVGHAPVDAPPARPLDQQELTRPLPAGLPSALLTNRPDLRAAELRLRASQASIRAARAAFFPGIVLTGTAGTASAELGGLFAGGSGSWNFMPVLRMPLFDGGRTQANLDLATARQLVAVADYESVIQTAFREVADALAASHWLGVQVVEQQSRLRAESERTRLARLRYERGVSSYLNVLDAERALFVAEQTLVQVQRAQMAATVDLYKALGGGQASAGSDNNKEQP